MWSEEEKVFPTDGKFRKPLPRGRAHNDFNRRWTLILINWLFDLSTLVIKDRQEELTVLKSEAPQNLAISLAWDFQTTKYTRSVSWGGAVSVAHSPGGKGHGTMDQRKVSLTEPQMRAGPRCGWSLHASAFYSVLPVTWINTWWTYYFMDCLGSHCQDTWLLHLERANSDPQRQILLVFSFIWMLAFKLFICVLQYE